MSGSIGAFIERTNEEVGANGRLPLQRPKNLIMLVDISPIFTPTIPTDMISEVSADSIFVSYRQQDARFPKNPTEKI
ncbi:hypothetical protein [Okeania sp.]|uniref:hypothetical protein n=1 Tax=Okeania sp. TaxID=3100323 RepID=UPI002B4B01E4|nr:hypothetical protein [Okeania sp.]MEB3341494.1 hypothetical protein [Okeania sp.]